MFQNTHTPGFETLKFQNIFIYFTPFVPKQCILIKASYVKPFREVESRFKISSRIDCRIYCALLSHCNLFFKNMMLEGLHVFKHFNIWP